MQFVWVVKFVILLHLFGSDVGDGMKTDTPYINKSSVDMLVTITLGPYLFEALSNKEDNILWFMYYLDISTNFENAL